MEFDEWGIFSSMTYPLIYVGLQEYFSKPDDKAVKVIDDAGNVLQSYRLTSLSESVIDTLSIAATKNGRIYVAGRVFGAASSKGGYKIIWAGRTVQSVTQKGVIYCVKTDDSGNVYVCGDYVADAATDPHDTAPYSIRKYNSNGALVWSKFPQVDFQSIGNLRHLSLDASGNIYICGWTNLIAKFDNNGNQIWIKRAEWELFFATIDKIIVAADGFIYTVGSARWITKWDSSGNEILSIDRQYSYDYSVYTKSFCMDDSSNIYMLVDVDGHPHLFKFNNSGTLVFEKTYTTEEVPQEFSDIETDGVYLYGYKTKIVKLSCADGSVVSYFDIYNPAPVTNNYPFCINLQQTEIISTFIDFESSGHRWVGDYTSFAQVNNIGFDVAAPQLRRDFLAEIIETHYSAELRKTGQIIPIKITSFSARKNQSGLSLSAVLSTFDIDLLLAISSYTDWTLVIVRLSSLDGKKFSDDFISAPLQGIRYDIGSTKASMTFSASTSTINRYSQTRQIKNISYSSLTNNKRRVRGSIDLYLEIGDTADIGNGETFVVGDITYYCSTTQSTMEISEE